MASNRRLEGRVAIVVGAGSSGPGWTTGKASAVLCAREGAQVVVADVDPRAAEETAEIIRLEGGRVLAVPCDATDVAQVERLAAETVSAFKRIDILIDTLSLPVEGRVVDVSAEDWQKAFAVNLSAAVTAMKAVIPVMAANGGGSIVNVSSIASHVATGPALAAFAASKAALNQVGRAAAIEHAGSKIRVNTVVPGFLKTGSSPCGAAKPGAVPLGDVGDAWDVAYAALYLASSEARFVTGIELVVDGGVTLKCG